MLNKPLVAVKGVCHVVREDDGKVKAYAGKGSKTTRTRVVFLISLAHLHVRCTPMGMHPCR